MKKLVYLVFLLLSPVLLFNSCDEEVGGTKDLNYITFESATLNLGVAINGTTEHEVKVYTTQVKSADRTFSVNVVTASTTATTAAYVVPATVTVPANSNVGILKVTLKDVSIGDAGKKLVLEIASEEGLFKGPAATINISQICPLNDVRLNLVFDKWASEISWQLLSSTGTVLYSGSGYADGLAQTTARFCLADGTYTFKINDSYGDGLSDPSGSATISKGTTTLATVSGNFGSSATRTFTVTK